MHACIYNDLTFVGRENFVCVYVCAHMSLCMYMCVYAYDIFQTLLLFVVKIPSSSEHTAIPMIIEGELQDFQRFSSSKLVLKTVESCFVALNYYGNDSMHMHRHIRMYT